MVDKRFPHSYSAVLAELERRLKEPAPGRVQLLSGPRQVGKTHLLHEIERGLEGRVVFAAADSPASGVSGWWEAQWRQAEARAATGETAVIMIDEIHFLPDWSRRLKAEYDRIVREGLAIHVVVTGSSSLTLGAGSRETMAGRFEHLRLLHWPPSELVRQLGMDEERAARLALTHGTYPGAMPLVDDEPRWRAYVRDAIVEPAIGRDILLLEAVRRPAMLRQVFAVAAAHPAEIVSLQKLRGQLADPGALETIAHYLQLLEQAYLVAPLEKFSARRMRRRAAPPKLVVLNQAMVAALAAEPVDPADGAPEVSGPWVENACAALAWNAGQDVSYWREEPLEVDMVVSGSWGDWAIEVKSGRFGARDLAGLLEFCRRHRRFEPLLVCRAGAEHVGRGAGVATRSWRQFLLDGPPS